MESTANGFLGEFAANAQSSLQRAPYMAILPGLFVIFTIYSFNNLGDMIKRVLQREVCSKHDRAITDVEKLKRVFS